MDNSFQSQVKALEAVEALLVRLALLVEWTKLPPAEQKRLTSVGRPPVIHGSVLAAWRGALPYPGLSEFPMFDRPVTFVLLDVGEVNSGIALAAEHYAIPRVGSVLCIEVCDTVWTI